MFSIKFAVVFSLLLSPQKPVSAVIAMALRSICSEVSVLFGLVLSFWREPTNSACIIGPRSTLKRDVIDPCRSFIGTSLQSRIEGIPILPTGKDTMKQSEIFRENAENCAHLAESAANEPAFHRYKRMEAAWRALADEQDWLDGEVSPSRISSAHAGNGQAAVNSGTSDSSA
jgi:hypothetical protein